MILKTKLGVTYAITSGVSWFLCLCGIKFDLYFLSATKGKGYYQSFPLVLYLGPFLLIYRFLFLYFDIMLSDA